MSDASKPSATGELTLLQKVLYASGHFGISVIGFGLVASVQDFYFPAEKFLATGAIVYVGSRLAIGVALALGRVTDAINDPLIGFLSDRLRTRWGRRKPLMVASVLPFIALYIALWYPPVAEASSWNFVYAVIVLLLLFVAYTGYATPYLALLPEIAVSERERVSLTTWQGMFNVAGLIVGAAGGALLIEHIGYAGSGLVLAGISFISFWLPCFGPNERVSSGSKASAYGFRQALGMTLRNRDFLTYAAGYLALWTGLLTLVANFDAIGQSMLGLSQGQGLFLAGAALVAGALCLPLARRVADVRGTKYAMAASMVALAVVMGLMGTVGLFGDERSALWQMLVLCILAGPGVAGLFAIPYAILAAITDADERTSGERREAMFFAGQGMILKIGWSVAPVIGSLLLRFLGDSAAEPLGFHFTGPVGAVIIVAGLLVFRRLPADLTAAGVDKGVTSAAGRGTSSDHPSDETSA